MLSRRENAQIYSSETHLFSLFFFLKIIILQLRDLRKQEKKRELVCTKNCHVKHTCNNLANNNGASTVGSMCEQVIFFLKKRTGGKCQYEAELTLLLYLHAKLLTTAIALI